MPHGYIPKVVVTLPSRFGALLTPAWRTSLSADIRADVLAAVQAKDATMTVGDVAFIQSEQPSSRLRGGAVEHYPKINIDIADSFSIGLDLNFSDELHDVIADAVLTSIRGLGAVVDGDVRWHQSRFAQSLDETETERKARLGR